jgi:Cu/Ag efflux protein CusF
MMCKVKTLDLTPLVFVLAVVGCGGPAEKAEPAADATRRYPVRGWVEAVDVEGGALRVTHEEIPGYMGAMTMRFPVLDAQVLSGVHEGDQLEATLVVSPDNRYWLEEITVTSKGEPETESEAEPAAPGEPGEEPRPH